MAARKLEPGAEYPSPRKVAFAKLGNAALQAQLFAAISGGAFIKDACAGLGITKKQYIYYRAHNSKFAAAVDAARGAGSFARLIGAENAPDFLLACKWLGSIDIARDTFGIFKNDLKLIFDGNPEFKADCIAAQHAGRMVSPDAGPGDLPPYAWGRDKLRGLIREAAAMEALT